MRLDGSVQLQVSAKSVGLFEAFYNSVKPVQLVLQTLEVAKAGKFAVSRATRRRYVCKFTVVVFLLLFFCCWR